MTDVFYAIPTANPAQCGETFARWRSLGYRTAALVDGETPEPANCDLCVRFERYGGYGWSVNRLCERLPDADWIVTGGDDTLPEPGLPPAVIAAQCAEHFRGTFGVMQPTGDPWLNHCIKHFAGSPWMGREFRRRIRLGTGPYDERYFHYFDDCALKAYATKHAGYWERPDLAQVHEHWTKRGIERPDYLKPKASREPISRMLYQRELAAGFPGSEPLPA